jgi:hypothetical protein
MTSIEEAQNLYKKFMHILPLDVDKREIQECALVVVNVILSRCIDEEEQYRAYKYWEQVKQEIEKL